MLIRGDSLQPWKGEPLNGILHPSNIEQLWTTVELNAIGLYPAVPFEVPPKGMETVGQPSYTIQGTQAIEHYTTRSIPPPTAQEIEKTKEDTIPPNDDWLFLALFDHENRILVQEGQPATTEAAYREVLKGFVAVETGTPKEI